MAVEPIDFCMQRVPELYRELRAKADQRAADGDERVRKRIADVSSASATARLIFEGEGGGEVFVASDRGELRVTRDKPAQPALKYALSMPVAAARAALARFTQNLADDAAERDALPGFASAKADKLFGMYKFAFDVAISAVPEVGDVRVRVALGRDLPPAPEFTVKAAYAELVEGRKRHAGMQELVTSGKISIVGDTAKAMMLGMTLTQLR